MVFSAAIVLAASAVAVSCDEVKVSQFGYDAADSTRFAQAALDSGAKKVVFDRREGPWVATPLWVRSNTEVVFEEGVELLAKRGEFRDVKGSCLLNVVCVSNVTIRGLGKGASLRMWIEDYHSDAYDRSEWRHALNIMSSSRIKVERMSFLKSGGDGIYLGEKKKGVSNCGVVIRDCVCDGNNRQGISVITADGLLIERTVLSNTKGTNPKAGIDFEPNSSHQLLRNCVMRDCLTKGNFGRGYEFYLGQFTRDTEPVKVLLENCRSEGDRGGGLTVACRAFKPGTTCPRGLILVRKCVFSGSPSSGIKISNKPVDGVRVVLRDCTVEDSPQAGAVSTASVRFGAKTFWTPPVDAVEIHNLTIRQAVAGEWISFARQPWQRPVTDVSGDVHVIAGGNRRDFVIDKKWLAERFPPQKESYDLRVTAFDPDRKWEIVDKAPGKSVELGRMPIRFAGEVLVYADSKREISFSGRVVPVSGAFRRGKAKSLKPFVVRSMKGRRVGTLPAFGQAVSERTFRAPSAGFYRISWDVGREAISFSSCDAPFGLVADNDGLDVYRGGGSFVIPHRAGSSRTVICGGGGGEVADIRLVAPSGRVAHEWKALGEWGFGKLDEEGLWRLSFSKPAKGLFEDSFANMCGDMPPVFFLSSEKYWR